MKILHVLAQLPSHTGSGIYFSNVVKGLIPYGHQQRAVFATQQDYHWDILSDIQQFPVHFGTQDLPFPIAGMSDVMPYDNTVYSQMTPTMIAQWQSAFRTMLEQATTDFTPDLIISHHLWMLTDLVLQWFPSIPVIGVCHNTDLRQAEQHPHMQASYVTHLHNLAKVFSLGEHQNKNIAEEYHITSDKIITIGGGFPQDVFYPPKQQLSSDTVKLVFSGKIVESKGVFQLIEAFRHIPETAHNISLDIVGNPTPEHLQKLNNAINNDPRICICSAENQKMLGDIFREKDIFVMPSFFEGLGLTAIEALASGLHVVATEIEGLIGLLGPDVNSSGVIEYVPLPRIYDIDKPVEEDLPQFVQQLTTALLKQINRIEQNENIAPNITKEIQKHSWEQLSVRINEEIERTSL